MRFVDFPFFTISEFYKKKRASNKIDLIIIFDIKNYWITFLLVILVANLFQKISKFKFD